MAPADAGLCGRTRPGARVAGREGWRRRRGRCDTKLAMLNTAQVLSPGGCCEQHGNSQWMPIDLLIAKKHKMSSMVCVEIESAVSFSHFFVSARRASKRGGRLFSAGQAALGGHGERRHQPAAGGAAMAILAICLGILDHEERAGVFVVRAS